ncbi:hypothetical protein ACQZV8_21690, partial [Magnetococcales bacterium HHB-1]
MDNGKQSTEKESPVKLVSDAMRSLAPEKPQRSFTSSEFKKHLGELFGEEGLQNFIEKETRATQREQEL